MIFGFGCLPCFIAMMFSSLSIFISSAYGVRKSVMSSLTCSSLPVIPQAFESFSRFWFSDKFFVPSGFVCICCFCGY